MAETRNVKGGLVVKHGACELYYFPDNTGKVYFERFECDARTHFQDGNYLEGKFRWMSGIWQTGDDGPRFL